MPKRRWPQIVQQYASERGLTYDQVGGLNPRDGPAALCIGGSNRITGELTSGFWGASCDASEYRTGFFPRRTVPGAVLAKAHTPDLADVVGAFNVESIEKSPGEVMAHRFGRKVEFESIDFNRRFLTTVPSEYDPVALRELFGPGFLDWVTTIDHEIEFGVSNRQLWFLWGLREMSHDELTAALENAGELFRRVRIEMKQSGLHAYDSGPWHAGLEPFPH